MNPTIIVAIVAGLVSLISAFIAWRQAERVKEIEVSTQEYLGRLNSQTQIVIEKFKSDSEWAKQALEIALTESKPIEQAIRQMWQIIQDVKDQIILIKDFPQELRKISDSVKNSHKEFMKLYGESGIILPTASRSGSHEAKNLLMDISVLLLARTERGKERRFPELSKDDMSSLLNKRELLTGCQNLLMNDITQIRMKQLQNYNDLLFSAYVKGVLKK
jgi:hypothetical protein